MLNRTMQYRPSADGVTARRREQDVTRHRSPESGRRARRDVREFTKPGLAQTPDTDQRIKVDLPNNDSTRSTATFAVALRRSKAGFSSTTSSDARWPLS